MERREERETEEDKDGRGEEEGGNWTRRRKGVNAENGREGKRAER